jgi:hypothetical protein
MTPEISLLSVTNFDWPTFRGTVDKALNMRPDIDIGKLPINLSDDAKLLLNIAAFYGHSIDSPLYTLRYLPLEFMNYLSYTFFIACDTDTWEEFIFSNNLTIIRQDSLILATGTLSKWYQTIVNNLNRDWEFKHDTRVLFCKLMIFFEKRGLGFLFETYIKKVQEDFTFLLEEKK